MSLKFGLTLLLLTTMPYARASQLRKAAVPSLEQSINEMNLSDRMIERLRVAKIRTLGDFRRLTKFEVCRLIGLRGQLRADHGLRMNGFRFDGEPNDDLGRLCVSSDTENFLRRQGWTTTDQLAKIKASDIREAMPSHFRDRDSDFIFRDLKEALAKGPLAVTPPISHFAAHAPAFIDRAVTELDLPGIAAQKLRFQGIQTVRDLTQATSSDILKIAGVKAWKIIRRKLRLSGLRFVDGSSYDLSRLDVGNATEKILRTAGLTTLKELSRLKLDDFVRLPNAVPRNFYDLKQALEAGPIVPAAEGNEPSVSNALEEDGMANPLVNDRAAPDPETLAFRDRLLEVKSSGPGAEVEAACEILLNYLSKSSDFTITK